MPEPLVVWLRGEPVGEINFARNGAAFHPDRPGIGLAGGLRDDGTPWDSEISRSWFENLLPEDEPRSRIAARFGLSVDDSWELLRQIGWECAGAVAVLPPDRPFADSADYEPIDDDELWERIVALPARPYDSDDAIRMSLGGIQPKLLLAHSSDGWLLPIGGSASTHILKPEPEYWPGLASAEAWALRVASAATPVAQASIIRRAGAPPTLVVERFDRLRTDRGITRIHQEDMCQVLGLLPNQKYASYPERPSHPSYERFASRLARAAEDERSELIRLLEQVTVNVALFNTDAHAKNTAVFHEPAGILSLTPMYDVVPTAGFVRQRHFGLSVAGKFVVDEITAEHLIIESRRWGIPDEEARRVVNRVLRAMLDQGVPAADEEFPEVPVAARVAAVDQTLRLIRTVTT